jgi:hypothetical protein
MRDQILVVVSAPGMSFDFWLTGDEAVRLTEGLTLAVKADSKDEESLFNLDLVGGVGRGTRSLRVRTFGAKS